MTEMQKQAVAMRRYSLLLEQAKGFEEEKEFGDAAQRAKSALNIAIRNGLDERYIQFAAQKAISFYSTFGNKFFGVKGLIQVHKKIGSDERTLRDLEARLLVRELSFTDITAGEEFAVAPLLR